MFSSRLHSIPFQLVESRDMKSEDSEQTEDVTAECVTSLNVFALLLLLFVESEPVLYDVAVVKLGRNGTERYCCFCCKCPDLVFLIEGSEFVFKRCVYLWCIRHNVN